MIAAQTINNSIGNIDVRTVSPERSPDENLQEIEQLKEHFVDKMNPDVKNFG